MSKFMLPFIVFCSALAHIVMWSKGHNWGGDFSAYIMQAMSLVDGSTQDFIDRNSFTIFESSWPVGPVTYPWGFPILIAPVYIFFGFEINAFKGLVLFFYLMFLVVLFNFFKDILVLPERFLLISLFAFNPFFLRFGDNVLSDIPFLFFSTLSLFVFFLLHKANGRLALYCLSVLLGVVFAASFSVRTNGILLPLTYVVMLFLYVFHFFSPIGKIFGVSWLMISEKSHLHRFFIFSFPLVIFSTITFSLAMLLPDHQGSHLDHLEKVDISSVVGNSKYYAYLIGDFFGRTAIGGYLYLLSIPFFIIGVLQKWRESTPIILYCFLTVLLFVLWPHRQGLRFIFPVLPFYMYFMIVGLRIINFKKFNLVSSAVLFSLLMVLVVDSAEMIHRHVSRGDVIRDGPYTADAVEMFDFIRKNVAEAEVVVFRKPRVLRLFTGKDSLQYESTADFEYRQWYVVDKKNLGSIDYVKDEFFDAYPASLVFENNQFQVFRFK